MGFPSIIRALGNGLSILGLFMLAPTLYALVQGSDEIQYYGFSAVITIMVGVGLLFTIAAKKPATDFRGGILLVLLWWVIAPIFGALPLVLSGQSGVSDAYFEAVSALTTTGAWLSFETLLSDPIGLFWRALMQWIGGLVSIAFAASVIVRPAFYGVDTIKVPFSRGERNSYLRSLENALISFFSVYLFLTLLCLFLLVSTGLAPFDATIMALSVQASGGLIPHIQGLGGYNQIITLILLPFVVFSGLNFVLISFVVKILVNNHWSHQRDVESETYIFMIFIVGIVFWILAGAGDMDLIPLQLFNAASLLSTNGFFVGEPPPLTVAIITALIGGAAISTAGGFKIMRWLVITRRANEEIQRLILPHAVRGTSRIANELGVWMHFLVFTIFLASMIVIFTFFGHSFDRAAAAAAATLSNTGPLVGLASIEKGDILTSLAVNDYDGFNPMGRWVMVVAMILGRIEAVAALALFNRAFWRS